MSDLEAAVCKMECVVVETLLLLLQCSFPLCVLGERETDWDKQQLAKTIPKNKHGRVGMLESTDTQPGCCPLLSMHSVDIKQGWERESGQGPDDHR